MSDTLTYTGAKMIDEHGRSIGSVRDVVYDGIAATPTWFVVKPGVLRAEHFVPAKGAYRTADGDVVVPYPADLVKAAPKASGGHVMSDADRALLTQYYGLGDPPL